MQSINIKGSTKIVSEFFCYAVQSILWQRGVYPEESFERKHEYDTVLQVTTEPKLKEYLANVLAQVENWAAEGTLQQLVMVVVGAESHETMERWVFNVETASDDKAGSGSAKEMRAAIGAMMRQISSTVTFLPLLQDRCTFDLLVYTDKKVQVPITWENSDPRTIDNAQQVKLRGFATNAHRVDASVAYRMEK
jgi:mitotic spindle assembly checkpoint protein MAD2